MNDRKQLPDKFLADLKELEKSYLMNDDPIRQSGYGGGYNRWFKERSIILDAIEKDGELLDIGCANGYLLECLMQWAQKKGIGLVPFGVDIGIKLIEMAKNRLSLYKTNFWVANAWEWIPPKKFRYVYTLHDHVPNEFFTNYVIHLLSHYVEPDGILIIGAYGSISKNQPARNIEEELLNSVFHLAGIASEGDLPVSKIAWIKAEQQVQQKGKGSC